MLTRGEISTLVDERAGSPTLELEESLHSMINTCRLVLQAMNTVLYMGFWPMGCVTHPPHSKLSVFVTSTTTKTISPPPTSSSNVRDPQHSSSKNCRRVQWIHGSSAQERVGSFPKLKNQRGCVHLSDPCTLYSKLVVKLPQIFVLRIH